MRSKTRQDQLQNQLQTFPPPILPLYSTPLTKVTRMTPTSLEYESTNADTLFDVTQPSDSYPDITDHSDTGEFSEICEKNKGPSRPS